MAWFKMASQRFKVEIAPPTGKICDIQDGRANSEIGYAMLIASAKIPEREGSIPPCRIYG